MRETEMEILLCKTYKNPETDGYERAREFRICWRWFIWDFGRL